MSYCTQQDMIERFGEEEIIQLTDVANIGVIDRVVLDNAIADATAEIDSYLTAYTLPLATIPAKFTRLACDIARYFLYDDVATDEVEKRFDIATEYLKLIATGKIVLGPDVTGQSPTSENTPLIESEPALFARNNY